MTNMTTDELKTLIQGIVAEARRLSEAHILERALPVNYACIFARNQSEYENMIDQADRLGQIVDDTQTGPVFKIEPLPTAAGELRLLKVRRPDPARPERGDADFTVPDYPVFKSSHLGKPGFKLVERKDMEMIELGDTGFDVLVYYSHPTLAEVLRLRREKSAGQ